MKKIIKLNEYKEKKKTEIDFIEEFNSNFMNLIQSDVSPIMLLKPLSSVPDEYIKNFVDEFKEIDSPTADTLLILIADNYYDEAIKAHAQNILNRKDKEKLISLRNQIYRGEKEIFKSFVSKQRFTGLIDVLAVYKIKQSDNYIIESYFIDYFEDEIEDFYVLEVDSLKEIMDEMHLDTDYEEIDEITLKYIMQEKINSYKKKNKTLPPIRSILEKYTTPKIQLNLEEKKQLNDIMYEYLDTPNKAINGFFFCLSTNDEASLKYLFDYNMAAKAIVRKYSKKNITISNIEKVSIDGDKAQIKATLIYEEYNGSISMKTYFNFSLEKMDNGWKIVRVKEKQTIEIEPLYINEFLDTAIYLNAYEHQNEEDIILFIENIIDGTDLSFEDKFVYGIKNDYNVLEEGININQMIQTLFVVTENEFFYSSKDIDELNEVKTLIKESDIYKMIKKERMVTITQGEIMDYLESPFTSIFHYLNSEEDLDEINDLDEFNIIDSKQFTIEEYKKFKKGNLTNMDYYFYEILSIACEIMSEYEISDRTILKIVKDLHEVLYDFYLKQVENGLLNNLNKKVDLESKLGEYLAISTLPKNMKKNTAVNYYYISCIIMMANFIVDEIKGYKKYQKHALDIGKDIFNHIISFISENCYECNNKCVKYFNHDASDKFNDDIPF